MVMEPEFILLITPESCAEPEGVMFTIFLGAGGVVAAKAGVTDKSNAAVLVNAIIFFIRGMN